ncbi:hypothetical protein V8C86DRAFT_702059 [Haematococcus lacustris]
MASWRTPVLSSSNDGHQDLGWEGCRVVAAKQGGKGRHAAQGEYGHPHTAPWLSQAGWQTCPSLGSRLAGKSPCPAGIRRQALAIRHHNLQTGHHNLRAGGGSRPKSGFALSWEGGAQPLPLLLYVLLLLLRVPLPPPCPSLHPPTPLLQFEQLAASVSHAKGREVRPAARQEQLRQPRPKPSLPCWTFDCCTGCQHAWP